MAKILTGVQSTGTPHLGNLLGAIIPAIALSNKPENESFLFIADLHSITQIKNGETLRTNTYSTAAAWLACGLNVDKVVFYRQSDVPQTAELSWYLSCFFPFQRLTLAHSFKDKADRLEDVNAGLFSYPMLMAADILLYDAEFVPVGKDQMQCIRVEANDHLYVTNDYIVTHNTSDWGWTADKKRDFNKQLQIMLYKIFYCQKMNLDLKEIKCGFVLLKRKPNKEGSYCEFVPVSVGEKSMERALSVVNSMVNQVKQGRTMKNRWSCRFCKFANTKHCM